MWVALWVVVGLIGVACLAAGVRMEAREVGQRVPPSPGNE